VPLNAGHCAMCASIGLWAVTSRSFIYAGKLLLMSLAKYQTAFNQHMYAYLPWPALLFAGLITALCRVHFMVHNHELSMLMLFIDVLMRCAV